VAGSHPAPPSANCPGAKPGDWLSRTFGWCRWGVAVAKEDRDGEHTHTLSVHMPHGSLAALGAWHGWHDPCGLLLYGSHAASGQERAVYPATRACMRCGACASVHGERACGFAGGSQQLPAWQGTANGLTLRWVWLAAAAAPNLHQQVLAGWLYTRGGAVHSLGMHARGAVGGIRRAAWWTKQDSVFCNSEFWFRATS